MLLQPQFRHSNLHVFLVCLYIFIGNLFSDINECANETHPACLSEQENGVCINNNGSYSCSCLRGYTGDGVTSCVDINECVLQLHYCFSDAGCFNNVGNFTCVCPVGYVGDGIECTNINECEQTPDVCELQSNTVCVDTEGSYNCNCKPGFQSQNGNCVNINECDDRNMSMCSDMQECVDIQGSFYCR